MTPKQPSTERRTKRSSDPKQACQYQLEAAVANYQVSGLSLSDAMGQLLAACCHEKDAKPGRSIAVEQVQTGEVTMFLVGLGPEPTTRAALAHAALGVKRIMKNPAK
jgi:hypothetical protein